MIDKIKVKTMIISIISNTPSRGQDLTAYAVHGWTSVAMPRKAKSDRCSRSTLLLLYHIAKQKVIKIDKKNTISFFAGLIVGIIACYMLWGNVPDNRAGTQPIRNQLDEATDYNQAAQERAANAQDGLTSSQSAISNSITAVEDSSRRIEQSTTRISTIETGLDEVAGITRQSQQILDSVRERGQKTN